MAERRAVRTTRRGDYEPAEGRRERAGRARERADGDDDTGTGRRPPRRGRDPGLSAADVGQMALRHIAELTGKELEGVTGVEPAEDGWVVGVEVVEDRRIPSSTDILATYEIEIGMDGELVSYRRLTRYPRGRGDSSGGDSMR